MKVRIKLAQLLQERDISQREFSRMTEIRFPTINEMCGNKIHHLPLDNLAKICDVLNVQISDVLELMGEE